MDYNNKRKLAQIKNQKNVLVSSEGDISLTNILNSETCQTIISESREFRDRIYPPQKTIFTFVKQVLNPDKSSKNAVAGVVLEKLIEDNKVVSSNTGPYSKARQRLPEDTVHELVKEVGTAASEKALMSWKPYGRELKAFDGTTILMPDTEENQAAYPQHGNQKKGAGFPILRLMAIMSLTIGTVIDYSMDAHKGKGTGEQSLLRKIFGSIEKEDIVLGDSYFPSFFLMAELQKIGADGIFRGQSQRHYDFRKGEQLGKKDHVVQWKKPEKPEWMDESDYALYPNEMAVREFKVAGKIYVTTFLDNKKYPKVELSKIYEMRWGIEVNLRSIKTIMQMEMLSCKTPEMIRKEIGVHLLAYNCIRIIMAEACSLHGNFPWKISFKGTVQLLNNFMPIFLCSGIKRNKILYKHFLELIVKNKVGDRPGRVEPRLIKRRQKPFPKLNRPRSIEKEILTRKIEKMILRNTAS